MYIVYAWNVFACVCAYLLWISIYVCDVRGFVFTRFYTRTHSAKKALLRFIHGIFSTVLLIFSVSCSVYSFKWTLNCMKKKMDIFHILETVRIVYFIQEKRTQAKYGASIFQLYIFKHACAFFWWRKLLVLRCCGFFCCYSSVLCFCASKQQKLRIERVLILWSV